MGWCTVTNLVPSGKVASTWMSGIISAMPSITSARVKTVRQYWHPDAATLTALLRAGEELEDRLEGIHEGLPA